MTTAGKTGPNSSPFGKNTSKSSAAEETFDADLPEDTGFVIDADEVIGRVIDVEKGTSQSNNPMWTWFFAVNEGPHAGKELRTYTALTPAAMWKLREVCEALGLGEGGKTAKFTKKDAIGRLCVLNLEVQEYKGVKRSSIVSCTPHPDGAGTRAKTAAGPASKPAAPKGGVPPRGPGSKPAAPLQEQAETETEGGQEAPPADDDIPF